MKGVTTDHVAMIVAGLAANPNVINETHRTPNEVAVALGVVFTQLYHRLVDDEEGAPESPNTERQPEYPHDPLEL